MNIFKNKKGYSEAELMMVFALITLLGILCFTLIQAAGGAYARLAENGSNKAYAQIALSYIENRVRQGDESASVRVMENPLAKGENALVISGLSDVDGEELWILKKDNQLVEYYVQIGAKIDLEGFFSIADIESFDVTKTGSVLTLSIGYMQSENIDTQSRIITLRSEGGGYE